MLYQTPAYALVALNTLPPQALIRDEDYDSYEVHWSTHMAREQLEQALGELAPLGPRGSADLSSPQPTTPDWQPHNTTSRPSDTSASRPDPATSPSVVGGQPSPDPPSQPSATYTLTIPATATSTHTACSYPPVSRSPKTRSA